MDSTPTTDAFAASPGMASTPAPAAPAAPPTAPAPQPQPNPYLNDPDPSVRASARQLEAQKAERNAVASIPREPVDGVDPAVRLRQLEHMKKHDFLTYDGKGLAEEHQALLEAHADAAQSDAPQTVQPLSATDSKAMIEATDDGSQLLQAWGDQFDEKLATAQRGTTAILADLGDQANQAQFLSDFYSQMPGGAQIAVAHELADFPPADITSVSPEVVHSFQTTETGKQLVAEWGSEAPKRIATIRARMKRVLGTMEATEVNKTMAWFEGLSDFEAKAVVKHLAR